MIRRLLQYVFAVSIIAGLVSCNRPEQAKTPGPAPFADFNAAVAPAREDPRIWTAADLPGMLEDHKEMKRVWTRFERSQKYRLAQPGEIKHSAFMIWWGAEAYQGDQFLAAIVVDPSRNDSNRYGFVVIAAPEFGSRKYKVFWVEREKDLSGCKISGLSGSLFVDCVGADGTKQGQQLAWFRSRRRFELKDLYSSRPPGK